MTKKTLKYKKIAIVIFVLSIIMSFSVSYAAWWGTPGYEWALSCGLTGAKTRAQLDVPVELDDLYATILAYLQMQGKYPLNKQVHHADAMEGMDNVAKGYCDRINYFNSQSSIKIQDFYKVCEYANEGYSQLDKYKSYSLTLTREDLKNLETYLRLSKYRAATLIGDRSDREYALGLLGYVKNSNIINYGMLPYTTKISRREFLCVMYDLLAPATSNNAIDIFYENGSKDAVLIGYTTGLELDQLLTYTEMYTFLQRIETFDFETGTHKTIFSDMDDYIDKAYEGTISRNALINYLLEVAEYTNYQVDLYERLNEELGSDWTVREAGDLLYDISHDEGFSYTSGRETINWRSTK